MGKRPYYLITHLVDCDGYATYTDYLGVNAQAAIERFKHLAIELRQRYFINEGVGTDNIYYGNDQTWEEAMGLTQASIDTPGKVYTLYMNDDNCCWIHVRISVIETGEFFGYPHEGRWDNGRTVWSDNWERENEYKASHPNAKY